MHIVSLLVIADRVEQVVEGQIRDQSQFEKSVKAVVCSYRSRAKLFIIEGSEGPVRTVKMRVGNETERTCALAVSRLPSRA